MKIHFPKTGLLASLMVPTLTRAASATPTDREDPMSKRVRAANARFHDVSAALAEGYGPDPGTLDPTLAATANDDANGGHRPTEAEIEAPHALMYKRTADGSLVLVGVGYIKPKLPTAAEADPSGGTAATDRYSFGPDHELHVWPLQGNASQSVADMNPTRSCDACNGPR